VADRVVVEMEIRLALAQQAKEILAAQVALLPQDTAVVVAVVLVPQV
jgi:hypothetical protein